MHVVVGIHGLDIERVLDLKLARTRDLSYTM